MLNIYDTDMIFSWEFYILALAILSGFFFLYMQIKTFRKDMAEEFIFRSKQNDRLYSVILDLFNRKDI